MIVTITLNPAIDKTASVEAMIPEKKLRCSNMRVEPGGGGINVSKALAKLGRKSLAIFPSGGLNGQLLENFMTDLEIDFKAIPIIDQTRESFTVDESKTGAQYRFVLPGPTISQADIDNIFDLLKKPFNLLRHISFPAEAFRREGLKTSFKNWRPTPNQSMPGVLSTLPAIH